MRKDKIKHSIIKRAGFFTKNIRGKAPRYSVDCHLMALKR